MIGGYMLDYDSYNITVPYSEITCIYDGPCLAVRSTSTKL